MRARRGPGSLAAGSFRAMGAEVTVLAPSPHHLQALRRIRHLFARWERSLSRFEPASELSRLNRHGGRPFRASPLLLGVLSAALQAAEATDGDFDPTLLVQLEALGYDRSFETLAPETRGNRILGRKGGGWRQILIDGPSRTVTLPPGVAVELGGIAKGMAVDAAVTCLAARDLAPALVNAGGDLAVTGPPRDRDHWAVAVQHLAEWIIPLRSGALATSSVTRRRWRAGGLALHHLLDPSTGLPAGTGLKAVTVAAGSCREADVAAKTALIRGPARGAAFLEARRLAGLLAFEDGRWLSVGGMTLVGRRDS